MTADPAVELAAALRRLLDSLNGRPVDRRAAAAHARDTLSSCDPRSACPYHEGVEDGAWLQRAAVDDDATDFEANVVGSIAALIKRGEHRG